ncbi:carbohydrate ABC transporter permease [Bacillus sp. FSL K6-3431]|uniref:carbohydrate ABC transporter permease n=1 Tax=Bacillus sp. FSL K6-3431 TaxID=2921500 RepID=UPI0030F62420
MPGYKKKEILLAYFFVASPIIGFLLFGLVPTIWSVGLSFTEWNLIDSPKFIGIDNYKELVKDEKLYKSIFNTVYLMIGIPIGMIISLVLAVMMNRKIKGITVFRAIYYIPVISPIIAVALVWQWIFNYDYGLLNNMLWEWFGMEGPNWLGNAAWVKPSLIIIGVWAGVGGTMILYLAGLQSIPDSYYEAADVDGANIFQKFFRITLPLLTPIHFFVLVMGVIGSFQSFSQIYVLASDGGPEYSAATIVFYIFENGFKYYDMGYASAAAWILGVIVFIVTLIQFKLSKRWVYEG